jgi:hypothetical protein
MREGHSVTLLVRTSDIDAGGGHDRVTGTASNSRTQKTAHIPAGAQTVVGNPMRSGPWFDTAYGHDVIINLAGAPIFTRWTNSVKRLIRDSRVLTTQNLVAALSNASDAAGAAAKGDKKLLISASAVGYYGDGKEQELDENSPPGRDFLAATAIEWETAAMKAQEFGRRVVITRFGVVLGEDGGALKAMLPTFKRHMGSALGSGTQWFPWIHVEDLVDIFIFMINGMKDDKKIGGDDDKEIGGEIGGVVNCVSPHPVRNSEFTSALAMALGKRPYAPPVPTLALKLALGEASTVILSSQKVMPRRLMESGFTFNNPRIDTALADIFKYHRDG